MPSKKHIATVFFGILLSCLYLPKDFFGTLHAETHLEFEDYVKHFKYPVQRHEVVTPDGYILTVFRIQSKYQQQFKNNLPVVFLQHGLLDSSDTFILNQETKAPAFILANRGYDVWLGNFRGNKHSLGHVTLDKDSPNFEEVSKYWEFSFHEMGTVDIPAAFEYIHHLTQRKINFIGHSQGSMAMFVALTTGNPVVESMMSQFIALGPIAYIEHITSVPLQLYNIVRKYVPLVDIFKLTGMKEFLPSTWISTQVISRACNILPLACSYAYGLVGSHDPLLDQNDRYDVISAHIPSEFKHFDYGKKQNILLYGQEYAPLYDLSKITIPVALFLGTEDRLSSKGDVMRLKNELVNSSHLYFREIHSGHTSFMWGKDMSYFQEVLNLLEHHDIDANSYHPKCSTTQSFQPELQFISPSIIQK